jgi:hypothetical protein
MSEKVKTTAAQTAAQTAVEPVVTPLLAIAPLPEDTPSPTITVYHERANQLLAILEEFFAAATQMSEKTVSRSYVRKNKAVPAAFKDEALGALLSHPEMQGITFLDMTQVMDDRQYVDAMRPVSSKFKTMSKALDFEIAAREAREGGTAQKAYGMAKVVVRDRENATLLTHVNNMARILRASRRPARKTTPADVPAPAGKEGTTTTNVSSSKQ